MKPAEPADPVVALAWWTRVLVNIYGKLYGSAHAREFHRDLQLLIRHILWFRRELRSRGWDVPDARQERFLADLVTRAAPYLDASGGDRQFIPSYLLKSFRDLIAQITDKHREFKSNPLKGMSKTQVVEWFEQIRAQYADGLLRGLLGSPNQPRP